MVYHAYTYIFICGHFGSSSGSSKMGNGVSLTTHSDFGKWDRERADAAEGVGNNVFCSFNLVLLLAFVQLLQIVLCLLRFVHKLLKPP